MKLIDESCSVADVAAYCIDCVCLAVEKMTVNLRHEYKDIAIIYAGGVMSNRFIKASLKSTAALLSLSFQVITQLALRSMLRSGKGRSKYEFSYHCFSAKQISCFKTAV